jgi:hypothetical protein
MKTMRKAKAASIACGRRNATSQTPWEDWVSTSPAPVNGSAEGSLRDRIERLAYSYWEQRGCQDGSAEEDWYRAEAEIAAEEADRSKLVPIS